MILVEYRISLPLSLEDWKTFFKNCDVVDDENEGGNEDQQELDADFQIIKNEENYTEAIYRAYSNIKNCPNNLIDYLTLNLALNHNFPEFEAQVTSTKLSPKSVWLNVKGKIVEDAGSSENALNLSETELALRKVINIELVNEEGCDPDCDPTNFRSEKTGRGPLSASWKTTSVTQ
jgi:hypothetical protein